jgi:toxin ParE1/3/4
LKARFSSQARNDLLDIAEYIAVDSPRRARSYVRELRTCAITIARSPEAFPIADGQGHRGIRRRVYGNYLIFYRASGDRLQIPRIVHGARD